MFAEYHPGGNIKPLPTVSVSASLDPVCVIFCDAQGEALLSFPVKEEPYFDHSISHGIVLVKFFVSAGDLEHWKKFPKVKLPGMLYLGQKSQPETWEHLGMVIDGMVIDGKVEHAYEPPSLAYVAMSLEAVTIPDVQQGFKVQFELKPLPEQMDNADYYYYAGDSLSWFSHKLYSMICKAADKNKTLKSISDPELFEEKPKKKAKKKAKIKTSPSKSPEQVMDELSKQIQEESKPSVEVEALAAMNGISLKEAQGMLDVIQQGPLDSLMGVKVIPSNHVETPMLISKDALSLKLTGVKEALGNMGAAFAVLPNAVVSAVKEMNELNSALKFTEQKDKK